MNFHSGAKPLSIAEQARRPRRPEAAILVLIGEQRRHLAQQIPARELAHGAAGARTKRRVGVGERMGEMDTRVVARDRARTDADAPQPCLGRRDERGDDCLGHLPIDPAQRRDDAAQRPRLACALDHRGDPLAAPAFERQHHRREILARLGMLQLREQEFPAVIAGDTETVDMRLESIVELDEILQRIMWRAHRVVAHQPKERGILGML